MTVKNIHLYICALVFAFIFTAVNGKNSSTVALADMSPAPTPSAQTTPMILPTPAAQIVPTVQPTPIAQPAPTIIPTPTATPVPAIQPKKSPIENFKYLGWWGNINYDKTGIYEKPTRDSKYLGVFTTINRVKVLEEVDGEIVGANNLWYKIDGGVHPGAYIFSNDVTPVAQPTPPEQPKIPPIVKEGEYWVDVDLTKKILTLFFYDKPVFATYVSTGLYSNPTLPGTYKIYYKIEKTRMRGQPPATARSYDLPNVPYAMFYRGSYSLHGTYWHDKFGTRQSSGCTNLTQGDAKFIYDRINPVIKPPAKLYTVATADNPGTVVFNHY